VLQCVAVCCSVVQFIMGEGFDHSARTAVGVYTCTVCCSVLRCVAGCCSGLKCVAVCCSVLQCLTREEIDYSAQAAVGMYI